MILRIYNHVRAGTTHAKLDGIATMWVVSANMWHVTFRFLKRPFFLFLISFLGSCTAYISRPILTIYMSYDGPASVASGLTSWSCSAVSLTCWLVRQGVGSSPTPAGMSSQVSACYEIKFSGRYRGFACVLFELWQAITSRLVASGCGESQRCGQQMVWVSGLIGRPHVGTDQRNPPA